MDKIIVNGSFDLLHPGHIRLLNYAKSLGQYLLVATDSDDRISKLKGSDRPFNSQHERVTLLSNLKAVDEVLVFNSQEELIAILKNYKPDIIVKGSDYEKKDIVEKEYCGDIRFVERDEYSTTAKIQDFSNRG